MIIKRATHFHSPLILHRTLRHTLVQQNALFSGIGLKFCPMYSQYICRMQRQKIGLITIGKFSNFPLYILKCGSFDHLLYIVL